MKFSKLAGLDDVLVLHDKVKVKSRNAQKKKKHQTNELGMLYALACQEMLRV